MNLRAKVAFSVAILRFGPLAAPPAAASDKLLNDERSATVRLPV
jgi:hypothetical protein